jgi:hypothetical protein
VRQEGLGKLKRYHSKQEEGTSKASEFFIQGQIAQG